MQMKTINVTYCRWIICIHVQSAKSEFTPKGHDNAEISRSNERWQPNMKIELRKEANKTSMRKLSQIGKKRKKKGWQKVASFFWEFATKEKLRATFLPGQSTSFSLNFFLRFVEGSIFSYRNHRDSLWKIIFYHLIIM